MIPECQVFRVPLVFLSVYCLFSISGGNKHPQEVNDGSIFAQEGIRTEQAPGDQSN